MFSLVLTAVVLLSTDIRGIDIPLRITISCLANKIWFPWLLHMRNAHNDLLRWNPFTSSSGPQAHGAIMVCVWTMGEARILFIFAIAWRLSEHPFALWTCACPEVVAPPAPQLLRFTRSFAITRLNDALLPIAELLAIVARIFSLVLTAVVLSRAEIRGRGTIFGVTKSR